MASPLQQLDALAGSKDLVFVVFYRGHWCPFCLAYLKSLQALSSTITSSTPSSQILAITSEPSQFTQLTRDKSGYEGEILVDVKNEIAKEVQRRGWVNVAISEHKGYEFGMVQPGVLVLGKGGNVLESWAIVPSAMNLGGASDRPDLPQIWDNVQAKLKNAKPVHKSYETQSAIGLLFGKVFG